jgi:lipopolysaccharide biosynthesis glycosyltransferase
MNGYFDSLKLVAASASSRGKTLKQIISQYENLPESACYGSIEQVDVLLKKKHWDLLTLFRYFVVDSMLNID